MDKESKTIRIYIDTSVIDLLRRWRDNESMTDHRIDDAKRIERIFDLAKNQKGISLVANDPVKIEINRTSNEETKKQLQSLLNLIEVKSLHSAILPFTLPAVLGGAPSYEKLAALMGEPRDGSKTVLDARIISEAIETLKCDAVLTVDYKSILNPYGTQLKQDGFNVLSPLECLRWLESQGI